MSALQGKRHIITSLVLLIGAWACGPTTTPDGGPSADGFMAPDSKPTADTSDTMTPCAPPMADCDLSAANGCETDTRTDAAHCGQCGQACQIEHGTGQCEAGGCVYACDPGYTGPDCSQMLATCDGSELVCDPHAACVMVDDQPACQCDAYFEGDGLTCAPICGDEVMVEGEVCDDGNTLPGDGCRADCAGLEICGDGLLDEVTGEECDDANVVPGDGCDDRCELEPFEGPCGDGVVNIGEECDDGNDAPNDGCEACVITMSDAWTCDPAVFKAGDGCDCGCGQVDADCPDETAESCDFCGGEGACNPQDLSCQQIDPISNAHCE